MIVNCATAPMSISNGRWARSLKSRGVRVSPMVSMMMPRIIVCVLPLTHAKSWGKKNVTSAVRIMKRLALALNISLSFFSMRVNILEYKNKIIE